MEVASCQKCSPRELKNDSSRSSIPAWRPL